MTLQRVVIEITGSPKDLDTTLKKLEQFGKVDKANAEQFSKSHEKFKKETREKDDEMGRLEHGVRTRMERIVEYIAAGFATERIAEFFKVAIEKFEESERLANQLKFAVSSIAKEGTEQFKKLIDQSDNLAKSLNYLFSPTQIKKVQQSLLTAGLSVDQTMKLLPRLADISAKTGRSLEELGDTFTRAIAGGRAQELNRLGINFKTTGDKVEDFNRIMQNSEQFIGGAADAMDNLGFKAQEAANRTEVLEESIGSRLAPLWETLKEETLSYGEALLEVLDPKKYESHTAALVGLLNKLSSAMTFRVEAPGIKDVNEKLVDEFKNKTMPEMFKIIQDNQEKIKKLHQEIFSGTFTPEEEKLKALQEKNLDDLTNLYIRAYREQEKAQEKSDDTKKKSQLDYTKFSVKQLNEIIQAQKDGDEKTIEDIAATQGVIEKLNEQGVQMAGMNAEKELKRRQEVNKKILEDKKKKLEAETRAFKEQEAENKKLLDEMLKEYESSLQARADYFRVYGELQNDEVKKQLQIDLNNLQNQLNKKKITQEQFNLEQARLKANAQTQQDLNSIAQLKNYNDEVQKLDDQRLAAGQISQSEYDNNKLKRQHDINEAELKVDEDMAKEKQAILDKQLKAQKDFVKEFIDTLQEMTQSVIENLIEQSQEIQKANDYRISQQDSLIEVQKTLAEKGLKNDLAFEEKRRAELEAQNIKEAQRQKRLKELQTFLNSVEEFSKKDPTTAIPKALGVLAMMKGAEAVFAEDGAFIGANDRMSVIGPWGASLKHKSGNDVLLHAEKGEMVLPKAAVANLGINQGNYKSFLSMLTSPQSKGAVTNNEGIEEAVQRGIEKGIDKIPRYSLNDQKEIVETIVKNGIKTRTVHRF